MREVTVICKCHSKLSYLFVYRFQNIHLKFKASVLVYKVTRKNTIRCKCPRLKIHGMLYCHLLRIIEVHSLGIQKLTQNISPYYSNYCKSVYKDLFVRFSKSKYFYPTINILIDLVLSFSVKEKKSYSKIVRLVNFSCKTFCT